MNKTIVLLLPIYIFPVLIFRFNFLHTQTFNIHLEKSPYQPVNLAKLTRRLLLPSDDSKGNPTQLRAGYPTAC